MDRLCVCGHARKKHKVPKDYSGHHEGSVYVPVKRACKHCPCQEYKPQ